MTTITSKTPYAEPLCEWSRLSDAYMLCQSPGGIEDIEIDEWINE